MERPRPRVRCVRRAAHGRGVTRTPRCGRGGERFVLRALLLVALVLGLGVVGAGSAAAHGASSSEPVSVAQTLGSHELTLTWYPPADGTGPLPVRVTALGDAPDDPLGIGVAPAGGTPTMSVVRVGSTSRFAEATLTVDRPGPWEVVLDDGVTRARIPLLVTVPEVAGWVWAVRGGLAGTALGLVAAGALARRRPRLATAGGGVALVGISVAVTAALLSSSVPVDVDGGVAAPAPAEDHAMHDAMTADMAATDMATMPAGAAHGPGPVLLTATPSVVPGRGTDLALTLRDGGTGALVDDVAIHDDALIHLAVVGPGGRLWHVHPVRVAPGRYSVLLPGAEGGGYGVFAELERSDGGPQSARSAFVLGPGTSPSPGPAATVQDVAGMRVEVSTSPPVAGRATHVLLRFTAGGAPVRDLQTWLGMAGHLLILGPPPGGVDADPVQPASTFAHTHAMPSQARGLGPDVEFTYTFPSAGRYRLWGQVQRGWQIVTVPITLDVAPQEPTTVG